MGRHSGVGVEEYFGATRRSSNGAFYSVRKRIVSDTTSASAVTSWQSTHVAQSLFNEVIQFYCTILNTCCSLSLHCYFLEMPSVLRLISVNENIIWLISVYRMDRNQITTITARRRRREVSRAARSIVVLRRPRRKSRRSSLIVSASQLFQGCSY